MLPATSSTGLPDRHWNELRSATRSSVRWFTTTLAIAALMTLAAIYWRLPPIFAALAITVFVLFGLLGSIVTVLHMRVVRVIPYFQRTVGEIDTFCAGEGVARNLKHLDAAASQKGVRLLSSFGFNDDLAGEPLEWHSPKDGLSTVEALLQDATDNPTLNQPRLQDDLRKLQAALQRAADQDIPFCLLLLHGNTTSGHEWSVRQGTAF
jgi:hypothetical protein